MNRLPNSGGIAPLNWLPPRLNPDSGLNRLPNSGGIAPLNWFTAEFHRIVRDDEAAQLWRYRPAQLVPVEAQPFQAGEAAQLRRYLPAQLLHRGGLAIPSWRGCPTPAVSPRSTGYRGGSTLPGSPGCPTLGVSPRSIGSIRGPIEWTQPSPSAVTPNQVSTGWSVSQLSFPCQLSPSVALYNATSASRCPAQAALTPSVRRSVGAGEASLGSSTSPC